MVKQLPKNILRYAAWAVIVVLLVAFVMIVATRAGVDKSLVKQQLDQFAADLKQRGRDTGRVVELTYGDIEMTGGFTDRHAVVHDAKLLVKPLPDRAPPPVPGKANSVLITTPVIEIYPQSSDLSSLKLAMPQPIDVASEEEPKKSLLKVTTNRPWELTAEQLRRGSVYYLHLHQELPTEIHLNYLREQVAQGVEDKTPTIVPVYETLVLAMKKGESDITYSLDGSALGEGMLEYEDVSIMPDKMPDAAIKVGKMSGRWKSTRDDKQVLNASSAFTIDSITAPAEIIPYAPISFNYELDYQGGLPMIMGGQVPASNATSKIELKNFALHTKDSNLDITADFTTTGNEILPVGHAHVKLSNLPFVVNELKSHHLLLTDGEAVLNDIVTHISGQPSASVKDFEFDITRAAGGTSQVGHASFEELFALFLKNKLQQAQEHATAPVAATPAPAVPHGGK